MDIIEEGYVKKKLRGKITCLKYKPTKKTIRKKITRNYISKLESNKYRYNRDSCMFVYKNLLKRNYRGKKHINIFNEFRGEVNYCQKCGGTKGGLQIHHIDKNKDNNN